MSFPFVNILDYSFAKHAEISSTHHGISTKEVIFVSVMLAKHEFSIQASLRAAPFVRDIGKEGSGCVARPWTLTKPAQR